MLQDKFRQILVLLIIMVFSGIHVVAKDFVVTENYSHILSYKPSLQNRLSGVKDVFIFKPQNMTQSEDYVIDNLRYHLQQMGLNVHKFSANYKASQQQLGNVYASYHLCDDDISKYWKITNALGFVINFVEATGYYNGTKRYLKISVIDFPNGWQWNVDIDVPSKGEKLRKKFANVLGATWRYNPTYAFIPKSKKGNFGKFDIEQDFKDGNYNPYEGIYEGDDYTLGMKKTVDGIYYLIYLDSRESMPDWHIGDVKAELQESTTQGVFKGTWYGRWKQPMRYSLIFDSASLITIDDENLKETYIRMFPTASDISTSTSVIQKEWGGSAFALQDGYLVTNYHVIEGAKSINVMGVKGDFQTDYSAEVVSFDEINDLAILKITDDRFNGFGQIPYNINTKTSQVGEDIFVLGYPLTSTMGDEIKLTTGVVSSKTGYKGDIAMYQISAPIQPGNSGGPLFDASGNIIGIVSAKHTGAENVGYALKSSYLCNLAESMISANVIPRTNTISALSRPNKIKKIKDFVFMIKCSNKTTGNIGINNAYSIDLSQEVKENPKNYAESSDGIYKVRKGDTISSIARRNVMSATRLRRLNGLGKDDKIHIGQVLRLE